MAYEQCYSETKLDGCISKIAPWVLIGVLGLAGFGFYKLCTDDEFNNKNKKTEQIVKPETPKNIIEYNNVKTL